MISIILGYNGGPPEKCYDEEGGSSYSTGAVLQIPPAPHLLLPGYPIKYERSLIGGIFLCLNFDKFADATKLLSLF